jgi:hypothetical protein
LEENFVSLENKYIAVSPCTTTSSSTNPQRNNPLTIHTPPRIALPNITPTPLTVIPLAALLLFPTLVLPNPNLLIPECPFDVDNAAGSTVTVLRNFVRAVVANVSVACPIDNCSALVSKKTSAKPGAGTGTMQLLAVVSQLIVVTFKDPLNRPSTVNWVPRV